MNLIKCEKLEKSMAELQFSIDAEAFKKAVADVFKKEGKKYPVQGFRKGKAPKALIEKMYGADVFTYDAINELFPEAFEAAVKEAGVEPVGRPEVTVDSASEAEGATLTVKVAVKPEVKVGSYNGLTVEKTVHTVTDEAVDAELKRVQERNARELTREGAAQNGDIADIDFEGFVDGVAFEGGKAEHYNLTLGSGSFIPGFEDQIVGHSVGDAFDVRVTFPADYHVSEFCGKEAVFETTLHYIKESVTPELTDDWVKENLSATMNLNNIDELKAFVKSTMLYDNQSSEVYSALHDKVSYTDELPQIALDYYRDVLLYRIYTYAQNYGTTMDALLASGMMGSSYDNVDAYLKDAHDSIRSITQQALLMQAVAEKMGFRCDTATMNADFGRYYGTTDPTQYVTAYGENYVKMNVLQSDVMQNLIDNVKYE